MTEEHFPEIQAATEALEARIALTEAEVFAMKEGIKQRQRLIRSWYKALDAFHPSTPKKRAAKAVA